MSPLQLDVAPYQCRINEEHDSYMANYLRWSAAATLRAGCGSQPLRGISEYIQIRPAMYGELAG